MSNPVNNAARLQAHVLISRRVEGDSLLLADDIIASALDSSRPLTATERHALELSPLTLRRFRHLALEHRAAGAWKGSRGMLRAASSGHELQALATDDGCWTLHFVEDGGAWRVILALAANAPYAARLLRERPLLRVRDGEGGAVMQGHLDTDGECEAAWPFPDAPAAHFQALGGGFTIQPARA
ncbi:hypothetical protein [Massilia cavernae]|uniref:Uncharacterized protein n=1 Tax=Massilia cavernae TaxID=2320864 RepID=A0A418Y153_9BURK|nr:hypothetical protein [Massilia cavernae]RJG19191.1 hypothetical protein D3872_08800 [Massilia cavernae]